MNSEKKSKLASLFSGSNSSSKRGSPNSSQEEDEDENERLLVTRDRKLSRTKTSNEADYKALKEVAQYNAKLMSHKKVTDTTEKKQQQQQQQQHHKNKKKGGGGITKKELLEMEVSLLGRLSEQNDTVVAQKRLIVLLEARIESQEIRLAHLENAKTGSCMGSDEWFSSLFQ